MANYIKPRWTKFCFYQKCGLNICYWRHIVIARLHVRIWRFQGLRWWNSRLPRSHIDPRSYVHPEQTASPLTHLVCVLTSFGGALWRSGATYGCSFPLCGFHVIFLARLFCRSNCFFGSFVLSLRPPRNTNGVAVTKRWTLSRNTILFVCMNNLIRFTSNSGIDQ